MNAVENLRSLIEETPIGSWSGTGPTSRAHLQDILARLDAAEAVVEAAREYGKWAALAASYPGHEDHVESEWIEIQRRKDEAEESLAVALAVFDGLARSGDAT